MRIIFVFLFLNVCFLQSFASLRKSDKWAELSFQTVVNGTVRADGASLKVVCGPDASKAWNDTGSKILLPMAAKETAYISYLARKTFQSAMFSDGSLIHTAQDFDEYPVLTETGETARILGYTCKLLKTSLRSNSIDIWYTTEAGVKGSPAMAYGLPDGLVLKIVRNGNYELQATNIRFFTPDDAQPIVPEELGKSLSLPEYRYRITEKLITSVSVFTDEQISFGNEIVNPQDDAAEQTFRYSHGTVILKKINLPEMPDNTQVYAELVQKSNGDAYDRTGSVFLVPTDKQKSFLDGLKHGTAQLPQFQARNGKVYQGVAATADFSPLIELMRFFTPFGVGHFNDQVTVYGQKWEDEAYYKQEITELLPVLQGECWIGVFIGNYDKGGHRVSLKLNYYPGSMDGSSQPKKKNWSLPLFNTLNVMEMSGQEYGTMFENDSLRVTFTIPEGLKNLQLRYISTGHGGWGGGDEYNQKLNTVLIDGKVLFEFMPWRGDCATYRKYNPASGNFWNGITSSDGSRSGWCPGTITNPYYFPITELKPGKHRITVAIPLGKREGSSFSSWSVSGILTGEFE